MTLVYETDTVYSFPFEPQEVAVKVITQTLTMENCPYETEINLLLTSDSEIQKLNQQFRNIDNPTDVLSFPTIDYSIPSDFTDVKENIIDVFHPETGELLLGDIVISVDRLRKQARSYGHSEKREFAFLIAHSVLHLLGYDHLNDDERRIMEEKQSMILNTLKILR